MPNHRNVYISLATSMSKTGKFQLTPLVLIKNYDYLKNLQKIQLINIMNIQYLKLIEWNQRKLKNKTTWIQQVINLTANSLFKLYKQIVSNK